MFVLLGSIVDFYQVKVLLAGALSFSVVACGGGGGSGGAKPPPEVALLSAVSGQSFDVGFTRLSTTISRTLEIQNNGSESATDLSFDLTSAQFGVIGGDCRTRSALAVGETCTLEIEFHTSSPGSYSTTLRVGYRDGRAAQSLTVELRGSAGNAGLAFALMDTGDDTVQFDRYLQMDNVDGIAVRLSWHQLQTQEPNPTWTRIDNAFAAAQAAGKKVTLHILSSLYGTTPTWVYNTGAASYNYNLPGGGLKKDPLPWDSVYLARWTTFLHELSVHLEENGYLSDLAYISVASPVPEMSLPACANGNLNGDYSPSVAYDRERYLTAWEYFALAMDNEFPDTNKLLPVPVEHICYPDSDGGAFYQELFAFLQERSTGLFSYYATDLSATGNGSERLEQISSVLGDADVGLQYTASYSADSGASLGGSLLTATCDKAMRNYNAVYIEVYKADLESTDTTVQAAINAIHAPWDCP